MVTYSVEPVITITQILDFCLVAWLKQGIWLQKAKKAILPRLLPIETRHICTLRCLYTSDINFEFTCGVISPDPSWRSTSTKNCENFLAFFHGFAANSFHTRTKHTPQAYELLIRSN